MTRSLRHFAENPAYGLGTYRRRLRFTSSADHVIVQLDDTHHAAWLTLAHDGTSVTAIDSGFTRAPATTYPGAAAGLRAFVGVPLDRAAEALRAAPMVANCTHLVDLANWAIEHRNTEQAIYDIEVPDQVDQPVWISILRNGAPLHRWCIKDFTIASPEPLKGRPIMRGFMNWARDCFSGDALMTAVMLQRGVFVARGRRYLVDQSPAIPLSASESMEGACWSYSGPQFATGRQSVGYVRDFTAEIEVHALPVSIGQPSGLRA